VEINANYHHVTSQLPNVYLSLLRINLVLERIVNFWWISTNTSSI